MVTFDAISSNPRPVTIDVMQGSVLRFPLFFNNNNDALNSIFHSALLLFADDINIVDPHKHDDVSSAVRKPFALFSALDDWFTSWMTSLSSGKSKVLRYKCTLPEDSNLLHGSSIACKPIIRDLGLNYSASVDYSEDVVVESAKARWNEIWNFRRTDIQQRPQLKNRLTMAIWYSPACQTQMEFPL